MRSLFAVLLALPLTACVVGPEEGDGAGGGGGGGGGGGSGSGSGGGGGGGAGCEGCVTGAITADTEWTGAVTIGGITTINAGVTVTVTPGTTLAFKSVASLQVAGTFNVQGASGSPVMIQAEAPAQFFGGVVVQAGGSLSYSHVEQTGGNIATTAGTATVTIVDSSMSRVNGDFILMSGGTLDMAYSRVGREPGETDTTHCNLHFGGAGNVIRVTHSNVSTSSYGLMFYGGMNADFKFNNWFSNTVDVDTTNTSPVSGDFSSGWFEKGAPSGTGITAETLAGARLVACDGTNDATCAGPRP